MRSLSASLSAALLALSVSLVQAQERIRDVIYLKEGGCAFTMDVFKPKTPSGKAVVWIVSGGWFSNHNDINADLAKLFTDRGYTIFEVVHGSQPKFVIPEIVKQVRRAIRFVHANATTYGIQPNEIGVMGASAGGHLSLMIAGLGDDGDPGAKDPVDRASSKVDAVVAFFPPTDFLNWGKSDTTPINDPKMAIYMPAFGVTASTPPDQVKEVARADSPILLVKPGFPPTLLVHGDADPLVPPQQSKEFDDALAAAKVEHHLLIVPGGGHDQVTFFGGITEMLGWFDHHLGDPKPQSN